MKNTVILQYFLMLVNFTVFLQWRLVCAVDLSRTFIFIFDYALLFIISGTYSSTKHTGVVLYIKY